MIYALPVVVLIVGIVLVASVDEWRFKRFQRDRSRDAREAALARMARDRE